MEGIGWIGAIIIGGFAGWVAEKLTRARHGMLTNIVLGILGAVVLNAVLVALTGETFGGWFGQFVVAAVGASMLIWIYRLVRGNKE
jgi:uncharacterized membrane protein YeaQ/YmgE (transglycosylase-associated protein family)